MLTKVFIINERFTQINKDNTDNLFCMSGLEYFIPYI